MASNVFHGLLPVTLLPHVLSLLLTLPQSHWSPVTLVPSHTGLLSCNHRTFALSVLSWLTTSLASGLCSNVTHLFFEFFLTILLLNPWSNWSRLPVLFFIFIPFEDDILLITVTICFLLQECKLQRAGIFFFFLALFTVQPQHLEQCLAHGRCLIGCVIKSSFLFTWDQWFGTFFANVFAVTSEIGHDKTSFMLTLRQQHVVVQEAVLPWFRPVSSENMLTFSFFLKHALRKGAEKSLE